MALKEAKRVLGVTTLTIQRWDKAGKIRVVRTAGGRRRIPESEVRRLLSVREERIVTGYARVSSSTQKDDLQRQKETIESYAKRNNIQIQILQDIGSGLNEKRKQYLKLIEMVVHRKTSQVIVAYKDRLTRFGFETLETIFSSFGTNITVLNTEDKTPQQELVDDLITVISYFAGKLYGMRSHRYRQAMQEAKKIVTAN